MLQALRGTDNTGSVLRPHSLLEDLYGSGRGRGQDHWLDGRDGDRLPGGQLDEPRAAGHPLAPRPTRPDGVPGGQACSDHRYDLALARGARASTPSAHRSSSPRSPTVTCESPALATGNSRTGDPRCRYHVGRCYDVDGPPRTRHAYHHQRHAVQRHGRLAIRRRCRRSAVRPRRSLTARDSYDPELALRPAAQSRRVHATNAALLPIPPGRAGRTRTTTPPTTRTCSWGCKACQRQRDGVTTAHPVAAPLGAGAVLVQAVGLRRVARGSLLAFERDDNAADKMQAFRGPVPDESRRERLLAGAGMTPIRIVWSS